MVLGAVRLLPPTHPGFVPYDVSQSGYLPCPVKWRLQVSQDCRAGFSFLS